jgi:hypothetical protein
MGGQQRWTRRTARAAAGAALIGFVLVSGACSSSSDGRTAAPSDPVGTSSTTAPGSPVAKPSRVQFRPVLEQLPPGTAGGPDVIPDSNGLVVYRLGPAPATNPAIESAEATLDPTGRWAVLPRFAPGAAGIDLFNELARSCWARDATCPTGLQAVVVDGVVLSAPMIQPGNPTYVPFEADQINLSGSFDESSAKALAAQLTAG